MFKNKKFQTVVAVALAVVMTATVAIGTVAAMKTDNAVKPLDEKTKTQTQQLASEAQIEEATKVFTQGKEPADGTVSVERSQNHKKEKEFYPVVILPGINHSPTYAYDENDNLITDKNGTPIGGSMFIMNQDEIISNALKMLAAPLVKMLVTQKDSGFTDAVYDFACETFRYQQVDNEGNHVQNLKTQRFYHSVAQMTEEDEAWLYRMIPLQSLLEEIGADLCYLYTFNLVGDIMQSVEELDEYIQMVKQQTGYDKVNILNVSLGGSVFTGYIDEYGWDDVNEVVNVVAALDGSDLITDIMARNFILDEEFVYHELIPRVMDESGDKAMGYLINALLRIIPKEVFQNTLTRAIDAILETMVANCPQFWAMVSCENYDELAQRYLNDGTHDVLKEKTDRYHQAQLNFEENILEGIENGVQINNISGSNLAFGDIDYSFFAIMASSKELNSDGIIQLSSTTMGAYGAKPGKTLPNGYVQKGTYEADPSYSYISPDGCIDASTSLLPDNTWIFTYQHHEVGRNTIVLNLAKELLVNDELVDVHSMPDIWPQFNGTCNNNTLRRARIHEAREVDQSTLSPEDAAELQAAIEQAEAQLGGTIADASYAQATLERLDNILIKIGEKEKPEEPSKMKPVWETLGEIMSKALLKYYGENGFSDGKIRGFFKFAA